uniref:Uncharacterized protein n=1 Tax=Brassica oleracea var. oleracea TaxID=109376 RepID=A0A0D2ZYJ3_BRAOL
VPIPDFDDFFAGIPSGFDAPPATNKSRRPIVVAEGSCIINGGEVPIPDFDVFFAGLPSGLDAPQATSESGWPKVVAEGSRIINGV